MLTRRKEPQRFNSRVAFAVSGGLLLYWQQTPRFVGLKQLEIALVEDG
jgi:hypothetical protein